MGFRFGVGRGAWFRSSLPSDGSEDPRPWVGMVPNYPGGEPRDTAIFGGLCTNARRERRAGGVFEGRSPSLAGSVLLCNLGM